MSSTPNITSRLANYLSSYVFDKVWNEPNREYRKNIVPYVLGTGSFSGNARLGKCSVTLPVEGTTFLVYTLPRKAFGGITLSNVPEWVSVPEYLNDRNIELRFEGFDGKSLYRGDIYIRTSPLNEDVLVAVKRKMFNDILGRSTPKTDIYISVYFDSDEVNKITIEPFYIQGATDAVALFNKTQQASFVLINGLYIPNPTMDDVTVHGSYVEVVTDENITGTTTFDLSDESTLKEFVSLQAKEYVLLHIPKALNPNEEIITHNTCDFFITYEVQDEEDEEVFRTEGIFVNRTLSDDRIVQVTHQDFGLHIDVITEYQSLLGTTDLTLTLMIRTHSKNNRLIRDKNYIDLLYTHTDEVIQEFLVGAGPEAFDFWLAEHLEASQYVKFFFDTPNSIGDEHIDDYIDALGYYHTIALISTRVFRLTLETGFVVPVPIVFGDIPIYANVSVNGQRLDDKHYITTRLDNTTISISFNDTIELTQADEITVELFENVMDQVVKVHSTIADHTHVLLTDEFVLHEVLDRFTPVQGINQEYTKTYIEIEDVSTVATVIEAQGIYSIVFNNTTYGRTFIIGYNIGFRIETFELDDLIRSNNPIVLDINGSLTDQLVPTTFELDVHTEPTSPTGTITDPTDPSSASLTPAWHLMNGIQYTQPGASIIDSRWGGSIGPSLYREAKYVLDEIHESTYYMTGFKIGNADTTDLSGLNLATIADLPTDFDILVDGVVVHSVRNEAWFGNIQTIHTHFLTIPIIVNSSITIRVIGSATGSYMAFDLFEPIFTEPEFAGQIPLLNNVTVIPYLNGRELVEGVDFELTEVQDPAVTNGDPHLSGRQLVITNASYLWTINNKLVLLITRNIVEGKISGFLRRDQLDDTLSTALWFDELSTVSVDGYSTKNISEDYGSVAVDVDAHRNGGLYGTRTLIPNTGKEFVDCFHVNDDKPVIDLLVEYFAQFNLESPPILLIPYSHRLVSPYLAIISRDMINGVLEADYLVDDQDFLDQFVDYDYLKPMDMILLGGVQIDLDFIDVQSTYVEQTSTSTILYRVLHRLAELTLPEDNVVHGRYDHEPSDQP
jgi:hypothetical protein